MEQLLLVFEDASHGEMRLVDGLHVGGLAGLSVRCLGVSNLMGMAVLFAPFIVMVGRAKASPLSCDLRLDTRLNPVKVCTKRPTQSQRW